MKNFEIGCFLLSVLHKFLTQSQMTSGFMYVSSAGFFKAYLVDKTNLPILIHELLV